MTHLSLGNSHSGSQGSSNSITPASIGEQLDDRRATLISEALDFPDELESTEYCGNRFAVNTHTPGQCSKFGLAWMVR